MTILRKQGPFEAEITGGLLSVHREYHPLITCHVKHQPWFIVHSDGLYAQNAHDALTPLYRGEDSTQLLACLTDTLRAYEKRRKILRWITGVIGAAVLMLAAGYLHFPQSPVGAPAEPPTVSQVTAVPGIASGKYNPTVHVASPGIVTLPSSQGITANTPVQSPDVAPSDGWSLPAEARAGLPDRLHKAASRGLFTVPLSSGHARTLYVFADPECANCRRMERHFETASESVNVVIFPVTTEGGQVSLNALTPVMVLPEAQRTAAWKALFSADAGVGVPGGKSAPVPLDNEKAEIARGAIGVNEVAFRAYKLPGTPWTISDDGRYVPQAVLSSPAALDAFLNGGGHDGQ